MVFKFKINDKVMGINAMYHYNDNPFYGTIKDYKFNCNTKYYEIYGFFPIKNRLTKDGGQTIWCSENNLKYYNEDKCNELFLHCLKINKIKIQIRSLRTKISNIFKSS